MAESPHICQASTCLQCFVVTIKKADTVNSFEPNYSSIILLHLPIGGY